MPLPTPRKGEPRKKFVSRCVSTVMHKGEAKNNKQAVAICFSQHRRGTGMKKKVRNRYQEFTVNWDVSKTRTEMLGGRPHLVVPMTMMVEGVHTGSQGPVLYTNQELKRTIRHWNHRPIVLNHPKVNGRYVSACASPQVLDQFKLGLVLNARFDGDRQRAEAWLDQEALNSKAPSIRSAIEASKPTSVSTGLFTDIELGAGKWNNEHYIGITTNHQPDHLALVPNQEGACSTEKGCGLLVNTDPSQETNDMNKKDLVDQIIANKALDWEDGERDALMNMSEKRLQQILDGAKAPVNNATAPAPAATPAPAQHACTCGANHNTPAAPPAAPAPTPVLNSGKKQMTREEWLEMAPPDVKEMHRQWEQQQEETRGGLIGNILANENNSFSEEWLKTQTTDVLQGLASIARKPSQPAPKPAPLYHGGGAPTRNTRQIEEEPLQSPTVNELFPQLDKRQTVGA